MNKQKILLLSIVLSTLALAVRAEEEDHCITKTLIRSAGTRAGFGTGLLGGWFIGCTIIQDKDTPRDCALKIGIPTAICIVGGVVGGYKFADKYITYCYPENPVQKNDEKPPALKKRDSVQPHLDIKK